MLAFLTNFLTGKARSTVPHFSKYEAFLAIEFLHFRPILARMLRGAAAKRGSANQQRNTRSAPSTSSNFQLDLSPSLPTFTNSGTTTADSSSR